MFLGRNRLKSGGRQVLRKTQGVALARLESERTQIYLGCLLALLFLSCRAYADQPQTQQSRQQTQQQTQQSQQQNLNAGRNISGFSVQDPYGANLVPVKPQKSALPDWTDTSKYSECGQDCLYQKGNENLSLQALYMVNKINNIQSILNHGGSDFTQDDYNSVMGEMAPYCPDITVGQHSSGQDGNDDASKCFERYLQVQIPYLRKLKAAIAQTNDSAARLQSNQKFIVQSGAGAGTTAQKVSTFAKPDSPTPKRPQTPEFETEDELLSTPEGQKKLQMLAKENYASWAVEQIKAVAPKPEDYVETIAVPRDPDDPHSDLVDRIIRNPDGSPKINEKEYQTALKEFKEQLNGTKDDPSFAQLAMDPKNVAKYGKVQLGQLDPVMARNPGNGRALVYKLDEISYQQARNEAVKATADLLKKEGVAIAGVRRTKLATFGGNKQAVRSNKGAQAQTMNNGEPVGARQVLQPEGDVPQAQALPTKNSDGDYTVSYKPEEIEETSKDFYEHMLVPNEDETRGITPTAVAHGNGKNPVNNNGNSTAGNNNRSRSGQDGGSSPSDSVQNGDQANGSQASTSQTSSVQFSGGEAGGAQGQGSDAQIGGRGPATNGYSNLSGNSNGKSGEQSNSLAPDAFTAPPNAPPYQPEEQPGDTTSASRP